LTTRFSRTTNNTQNSQSVSVPSETPPQIISSKTEVQLNADPTYKYIYGFDDGAFHPDEGLTRAQFAQIVFNLALDADKENVDPATITAPDVNRDMWYAKAVAYALTKEILSGYPDETFRPDQPMTRAELCAVLYSYFNLSALDFSVDPFTDISEHWAETYIKIVAAYSVITGYPDGAFRPDQAITRAEFVSIMNRLLMRISANSEPLSASAFPDIDKTFWAYNDIVNASAK
jgi:hypothetical protein